MADSDVRTIPVQTQAALPAEDQSRADLYALLARLLYAGPDQAVLRMIGAAPALLDESAHAGLAAAWQALVSQARLATASAEVAAFDEVFVGTGKAKVTPYLTHYLVAQGRERVLVALRDELAALGLARKGGVHEPEDHVAGLCEVMRHLVTQGSGEESLQTQRLFFDRYLHRSFEGLCDAIEREAALTPFYRAVGGLARAFLAIEARAFELLD